MAEARAWREVLACPDDKLERLIVALAGLEAGSQKGLALINVGDGAIQHEAVAVHDQSFARPDIEVTEPKLLVDLGDQTVDLVQPRIGNLEVERAGDVQALEIRPPVEGNMVIRPGAGDGHRQLVLVGALGRPVVGGGDLLDEIDWVSQATVSGFGGCHVWFYSSRPHVGSRRGVPWSSET